MLKLFWILKEYALYMKSSLLSDAFMHHVSIGSDNGLLPIQRQAII